MWTEKHPAAVGLAAAAAQYGHTAAVEAMSDPLVRAAFQKSALKEEGKFEITQIKTQKDAIRNKEEERILILLSSQTFTLTAMQKYPHPGQQWCFTMCERWTSHRTMRGIRLDGRIVSAFMVQLVQARS